MNDDLRQRIIDSIAEDSNLTPAEKETVIHFDKEVERAEVFSASRSVMKRLLANDQFEVDRIGQLVDGQKMKELPAEDIEAEFDGRRPTVSVTGTVPIGTLKIKSKTRSSNMASRVVGAEQDYTLQS